jgi:excinuclease ABC subunit A
MDRGKIVLKGVSVHNLKGVSLELDFHQLIVFTGVSGSGKSSLAFDTIYAEGQRRYIESLSNQARRYLGNLPKPDAKEISGIPPTIAIEQKSAGKNPRSTVGTMTTIYDYLRVLYARVADAYCPESLERVTPISRKQITHNIIEKFPDSTIIIFSPYAKGKKGEFKEDFSDLLKKGFLRVRVNKMIYHLGEEMPALDKNQAHDIEIVIDRITVTQENKTRLIEAVESALNTSQGLVSVLNANTEEELLFSEHAYSEKSGKYYPPLEPEDFSFNHPKGMCPACMGLGEKQDFDLDKIIDSEKSIAEDCCLVAGSYNTVKWGNIYDNLAEMGKFSVHTPWKNLSEEGKKLFLYGTEAKWTKMRFVHPNTGARWSDFVHWQGVIFEAKKRFSEASSEAYKEKMQTLMCKQLCPECHGGRLKPYPRAAKLRDKTVVELSEMMIEEATLFFSNLKLSELEEIIAGELVREIQGRLQFLMNVGLHYLTLSRTSPTLSGGESQRVRLASQIGFGLTDVLYILDEPSIGLHPRDNHLLLKTLRALVDKGNTVIVVEHDEETILEGDTIVDIGPKAGILGGEVLAIGSVETIINTPESITGAFLGGREKIEIPKVRKKSKGPSIDIKGATHHNLKNVDVSIPLGVLTVVTGVSGSGKSSLISEILYPKLSNYLHDSRLAVGHHTSMSGMELVDKIIAIDQSPIGRTPRSNPATYVKVFDDIRDLFARLPESLAFGYTPGRFSFNVREGSCYTCKGMGMLKIDMDFMEDEWITCSHCLGRRFDTKTLSVQYRGKNIADVLEMTIDEALLFFEEIPPIQRKIRFLSDVGLGYIRLGQSATTLSGGEAQRIKLSKELMRPSSKNTIYILDEPTTGLHFYDIKKLIEILQKLVNSGSSIVVIEHNTDFIKVADYIIDIGPEGGAGGGQIVGLGTPEEIAKKNSATGKILKTILKPHPFVPSLTPRSEKSQKEIVIRNASQNNLKDVSLSIPRNKISLFTGPSGSGKSSLAFETIYAEGQRRYIDSLSSYAKQFVSQMPKPKVEEIQGLSPAISIEQRKHSGNPRSTLGTMTEVYDYLRIVYARLGIPHCPDTGEEIKPITPEYVAKKILTLPIGTKLQVLAPLQWRRGDDFVLWKEKLIKEGYLRIRLNGTLFPLEEEIPFDKGLKNKIELVIDRLILKEGIEKRLIEAIQRSAELSQNKVLFDAGDKEYFFNLAFAVESTGKSYPPVTHLTFSFNADEGMCFDCQGLGLKWGANLKNDPTVTKFTPLELLERLHKNLFSSKGFKLTLEVLRRKKIDLDTPIKKLSKESIDFLFDGSNETFSFSFASVSWIGIHTILTRLVKMGKTHIKEAVSPFLSKSVCTSCNGSRLNPLARNVLIKEVSLPDLCQKSLSEALTFLSDLKADAILSDALNSLRSRLKFLIEIGLDYLSLDRSAPTLSGGEIQRTRLAKQLGSGLTGALYVLDEPTIALHPHNNHLLNQALKKLKNLGNTLILVEHDPMTMEIADQIYDFGPGGGRLGGEITAQGSLKELKKNPNSLTGAYLSGRKKISIPSKRRAPSGEIVLKNVTLHNLHNLSLSIPTGVFTCITGVSGSGKSTLIHDFLLEALEKNRKKTIEHKGATIENGDQFDTIISIDQNPIGRTSRSDISTYVDLLTPLRSFFARLPGAATKGLQPKHFSYNHKAGMCKKCLGLGFQIIELQFMPSAHVPCDACHGNCLNPLSLSVTYKGKNLGQILDLTVLEAEEFLPPMAKITRTLNRLKLVGLEYLTLGQSTESLSGGEASRLRLSKELAKTTKNHTLYIFDEPTTGLHFDDIQKILPIFHSLVNKKNTLIVIEHNLDIIANADYIIDIGPDAGPHGGRITALGTPEEVALSPVAKIAPYLKEKLHL